MLKTLPFLAVRLLGPAVLFISLIAGGAASGAESAGLRISATRATDRGESSGLVNRLSLGPSVRGYDYLEGDGALDGEKGALPGLAVAWELAPVSRAWYARVSVTGLNGYTTYDGSDQTHTILFKAATPTQLVDGDAVFGLRLLTPAPGLGVYLYTGLGYHYWRRGDAGEDFGVARFREDYSWAYLPFGLRAEKQLGRDWRLGLGAEGRLPIAPSLKAYLSQLDPGLNDSSLSLGSRVGCRVEAPVAWTLSRESRWGVEIGFTPWFEYSAIGESGVFYASSSGSGDPTGSSGDPIQEPSSRTYQYGGDATVTLEF